MYKLEPDRFYRAFELAKAGVATEGTLAQWRCHGRGPAYHRTGNKIHYLGQDINEWVNAVRVVPNGKRIQIK